MRHPSIYPSIHPSNFVIMNDESCSRMIAVLARAEIRCCGRHQLNSRHIHKHSTVIHHRASGSSYFRRIVCDRFDCWLCKNEHFGRQGLSRFPNFLHEKFFISCAQNLGILLFNSKYEPNGEGLKNLSGVDKDKDAMETMLKGYHLVL